MQQFNSERSCFSKFLSTARVVCLSFLILFLSTQARAQNFIVNNNGDTHAANAATSPLDAGGNITLRSAMEAATAQAGPHIITFAAGITNINLTLGQMNVGSATSSNITVDGPGMNILTVNQTTAARMFSTTTQPNFNFTVQDFTMNYAGPANVPGNLAGSFSGGGGAVLAGGTGAVTILTNCKFTNWRNQSGNGGAVAVTFSTLAHNFTMTGCVFDNNMCGGGGGAVAYSGLGTVNISNCTFNNNSCGPVGLNIGGSGGALNLTGQAPGGNYTVTKCTFTDNSADNPTSPGGAVMHVNGQLALNYNRFVGNTAAAGGSAVYQSGGDAAYVINATNNWWGHNTAPTAAEVSNGPAPVTPPNVSTWLQLKLSASPSTLCATTSPTTSLVTASFLSNSAGTAIPVANLTTVIGLPISFSAILGTLSGAQTTIQASGTATVTFTTNGTAGAASVNGVVDNVPNNDPTARASITVNILPSITTQPTNQTTCAGSTTTFTVAANGTPAPTYQWRKGVTNLVNGPTGNGSTISGATSSTLTITGTALADAASDYNVVASNSCGTATSNNVSLTVKALPVVTAPTVTQPTCTTPTGTIVVNATGASGTIEYSINNGGSYQASNTFSGLAPSTTHNIVVRYTASPNCPVAYASNPVAINAVPLPPTVNNPGVTTGTVGTPFSQTFTTTGGLAPITFATTSTLPNGLTLSSAGVLSGTPTQSGTFPIVVKATDANGCVGTGATYNLVISCQTITVTNPGVSTGTVGSPFSQTFTQTGALGGATFSLFSGTLPIGITLSAGGVLSGTPTQSGSFPIVVRVTDGNGCFANGPTYTLVISCQTITVTNPVVTTGQLNIPFSQTFTQTGGFGVTNFTLFSGSLPAGLTLSSAGVLSGTPTAAGTFPIVVRATDVNGCFGNGPTYTLVIIACPVVDQTVTASPTSVCTGTGSTITVGASQPGVNYTLRVDPTNTVVAGPSAGSGAAINFPTGNLTSTTTFNVLAETDKYSVYLDGSQGGFVMNNSASLTLTNNFTIEGWIKPDGNSNYGRLFNKNQSYALGLGGGQSQITFTAHNQGDFSLPYTFTTGTWYHIACTYASGTVEFFVNGASIGTVTGVPTPNTSTQPVRIGSDASGNFNQFKGNIDNVRVWSSVRTASEIATNQTAFLTSTGNPTLAGSWWIIEGSGNAKDYSSNGNDATGFAGTWQADAPVAPCSIVLTQKPTVTVIQNNTITLTSAAGTDNQTVCINTPIVNITYATTSATGATFSGLPAGVTGNWAANVVTISGTPTTTVGSPFNYTVTLTGGCGPVTTATGTITVNPNNTITLTSAAGTNNQTVCNNTAITNITYSTTGATGATFSGLPAGVTGNWAANVVTISGSPTTAVGSPFNYTVTLTGGCGTITANGTISVNPTPPTPTITPGGPTTFCAGGSVTLTSSSASGNQWYLGGSPIGGATSQTYVATASGSYTVVVTALGCPSAPSAATVVTVNPIPPTPTITPGGPTTFCAGGSVTLTSSSASGNQWYLGGNPIGGATNQNYVATAAGSYTVVVTLLGCSSAASSAVVVTVNPIPTVNAVGNQTVCNGAPTAAVSFSGSPAGTVFNWTNNTPSIGLAASGTGNIASFNGVNATAAAVTATITVTPSYTNNGVTCTGTPTTFTITVNPTPTVNSVANQTVCNGAPTAAVNFSGATTGTVYNWTNNTPSIGLAASGTGNIASFNGVNATAAAVTATITVTPSYTNNGVTCTGTPTTFTITVNPTPTVNAVANQTVCNGAPTAAVTFSGATTGTVFNWTNNTPSIGLAASGTGNIASFNGVNATAAAVTATITVTPSYTNNGTTCTGTPITFTITVNPTPTVNSVANQTVCNGAPTAAVTFSGATAGTVFNWTNNTPSIGLAASGTGNIASFNGVNATAAPVTATITVTPSYTNNGTTCTGTPTTFTITVNPTPTVNTVANQELCNGATTAAVTFSGATTGTVFNWTNNTPSIGLAASGSGNIAPFTAVNLTNAPVIATITVTPSYTNNGTTCTGTPKTFTITVNPKAHVNGVANQTVCNGAPTATVTFSGNTANTVYNWTNNTPSIGLAASGTGNIASFNGVNATGVPVVATITVTPTFNGGSGSCPGDPITFTITVNPTPTVNTIANQTVCNGAPTAPVYFSGNQSGSVCGTVAENGSMTLTAPAGAIFTAIKFASYGTPGGSCGNFTIGGCHAASSVAAVSAILLGNNSGTIPVNNTTFGDPCSGTPKSLSVEAIYTYPGAVYSWTNNTPSIGLAASGTGNIASFNGVNATAAPVTATITVTPSYTNNAVTCTGTPRTFTITVNPTPTVNSVANQTVCNGAPTAAVTFSGATAGTVFNWTNNTPSIGLAASGTGNIASFNGVNATAAPVTATITVTPSYTNNGTTCTGTPKTFTITVNPTPTVNSVANQTVCNGAPTAAVTFSGATAGTVYNWTNNTPSIGLAASGTGNIASFNGVNATAAPVTATITVTPSYTNNGVTCTGNPITFTITVNPTPTVNPVVSQTVCNGGPTTDVNFSGATAGTVFNWTNNNTSIGLAASGTGDILSFTGVNATNAPVTATITVTPSYTNNGTTCTGTPITFTITVNPTPTINPVANQTVCNNGNTAAVNFSSPTTGGTIVYDWSNNTPSIGLASSGSGNIASFVAINNGTTPITATITVIPSYTNNGVTCTGPSISFDITVNPTPSVNPVADQAVCNGSGSTPVVFTSPIPGTVFNWTNSNTAIGLGASGTGNIASFTGTNAGTAPISGTITVTPTYTNGGTTCTGAPITFVITINPTPTVNTIANQTVCNNANTAAVNFTGAVAGTVYNWTNNNTSIGLAASGTANIASFVATNATNAPVTATITVTPSYTNAGTTCTGTPKTFTITVNPTPTVNPVSNQTVCNGATTSVTFSGAVTGTVFNWTNNTPSIGLAASGTGNIPTFTATNAGATPVTATITVTPSYTNGSTTCTGTPITFTITVNPSTAIATQPTNVTLCAGGNASFTVVATGVGLTYQWQVNTGSGFNDIPGATAATLNVNNVTAAMNGYIYHVVVTGTCGTVTSSNVTLTVNTAPAITTQPVNVSACIGNNAVFTVVATGTGLTYQWQVNTGSGFTNIPGATSATLTVSSVTAAMNGYQYHVIITGTCAPPQTSNNVTLSINQAAVITGQPANVLICFGGSASFSVTATGTNLTYQWQVNTGSGFVNIPGATSSTLVIPAPPILFSFNQYRVIVSSPCNSVTSNTATLIIFALPNISFAKVPPRVCLTDTIVTLKAEPAGGTWSGRGVTGDKFSATAAGTGVSTLTYTVTNANGCISFDHYNITVNDCKERHNGFKDAVKIYPNPSNGQFYVKFLSDTYTEVNIRLIDGSGREVKGYRFTGLHYGSILPIDARSLGSGVYTLEAYNSADRASFRIVIAH